MTALALAVALVLPVHPHTRIELAEWQNGWVEQADYALSPALMTEWQDMRHRHAWYFDADPPRESYPASPQNVSSNPALGVEQWRGLVAAYFLPENVDAALRVLGCETGWTGDPSSKNPISSAAGLFQFLRSTWNRVAVPLGYGDYDSGAVFDPVANVHAASVLSKGGSDWGPWSCQP